MPSNSEQFGLRISEQRFIKIRTICEIPSQVLRFIGLVHVLVTFVLCLYEKGIKYTIPRLRNIYISVIVSRYYRLPKMPLINGTTARTNLLVVSRYLGNKCTYYKVVGSSFVQNRPYIPQFLKIFQIWFGPFF